MRGSLQRHCDALRSITVDELVSQLGFASKLLESVAAVDAMDLSVDLLQTNLQAGRFIQIASIDVDMNAVHALMNSLESNGRLKDFLETSNLETCGLIPETKEFSIRRSHHVTMAHFSQMSQADLLKLFQPFVGARVHLAATALLWSGRVAALAVDVAKQTEKGRCIPRCMNKFPHITVWCQEGAEARESNQLPALVDAGKAKRLEFLKPVILEGSVSLWEAE